MKSWSRRRNRLCWVWRLVAWKWMGHVAASHKSPRSNGLSPKSRITTLTKKTVAWSRIRPLSLASMWTSQKRFFISISLCNICCFRLFSKVVSVYKRPWWGNTLCGDWFSLCAKTNLIWPFCTWLAFMERPFQHVSQLFPMKPFLQIPHVARICGDGF